MTKQNIAGLIGALWGDWTHWTGNFLSKRCLDKTMRTPDFQSASIGFLNVIVNTAVLVWECVRGVARAYSSACQWRMLEVVYSLHQLNVSSRKSTE